MRGVALRQDFRKNSLEGVCRMDGNRNEEKLAVPLWIVLERGSSRVISKLWS